MSIYVKEHAYVYFVGHAPAGGIEFREPNVEPIALTGEAPHGFDGGWRHRKPKYPAILITQTNRLRHVPNTLVRSDEELAAWRKRYDAMKVWEYENLDTLKVSQKESEAATARNLTRIAENKERGDRAVAE